MSTALSGDLWHLLETGPGAALANGCGASSLTENRLNAYLSDAGRLVGSQGSHPSPLTGSLDPDGRHLTKTY